MNTDTSAVTAPGDLAARAATEAEELTARLDRLPMTRSIWVMAVLLTFGGLFDGYAIGLIGALGPGLMKSGIFTATTVGLFGLSGLASFVAALFAGCSLPRSSFLTLQITSGDALSSPIRCYGLASRTSSWDSRPRRMV